MCPILSFPPFALPTSPMFLLTLFLLKFMISSSLLLFQAYYLSLDFIVVKGQHDQVNSYSGKHLFGSGFHFRGLAIS